MYRTADCVHQQRHSQFPLVPIYTFDDVLACLSVISLLNNRKKKHLNKFTVETHLFTEDTLIFNKQICTKVFDLRRAFEERNRWYSCMSSATLIALTAVSQAATHS
jgi:hypothetical protein